MIILTPVLLFQAILAYVFFNRHWDTMTEKLIYSLSNEVNWVVKSISDAKTDQEIKNVIIQAKALDLKVTIEKDNDVESRKPRYTTPKVIQWLSVRKRLEEALHKRIAYPVSVSGYAEGRWFEINANVKNHRLIKIVVPERRLTSPTSYVFILWMIGGGAVLFAISVVFMRNQVRPIHRLAIAAEKFGKGQDVANFKPEGASEVRKAAKAFLEMKERLKRQIEQRTSMLAGVSHDLRTPLTRMKLQLALPQDEKSVESLRQDIAEMEKMIEGYLTFARGEGDETPEMTDLRVVVDRVLSNARRQGFEIDESLVPKIMIRVRPVAIERAISNVISNACAYAKHVWVTARMESSMAEIIVEDNGPGIPQHLREDVFRPFYRVEKSRNKKTGGVGLGLSIAKDAIHAHGGEIVLEDSSYGGLRVIIRLPA